MKINETMEIGHAMMEFTKRFRSFMKSELASSGINFNEGITLMALCEEKTSQLSGSSAEKLIDIVTCDKSVMTRTLQSLEKKNLVIRQPNPDDGRSWVFTLTDTGKNLTETVIKAMTKWANMIFSNITEQEIQILMDILKKM